MKSASITLEVSANIDLNSTTAVELKAHMQAALARAIGDGLLTGFTSAEVEQYSAEVTINRHDTYDDEITRFLQGQIEDGHLDAESMAQRITRYGLMLPSDFIDEMQERATDSIPEAG